jgi:hypothetical protein
MQSDPSQLTTGKLFEKVFGFQSAVDFARTPLESAHKALQRYQGAERYTEAALLADERRAELARRNQMSLAEYQGKLQQDPRFRASQQAADTALGTDTEFMAAARQRIQPRVGMLTARGVAERDLYTAISKGIAEGGDAAAAAQQAIGAAVGETVGPSGAVDAAAWKALLGRAQPGEQFAKLQELQQMSQSLTTARTETGKDLLARTGLAMGIEVSRDEILALSDLGDRAEQLGATSRGSGTAKHQKDAAEAAAGFLENTRGTMRAIQESADDMMQLGREGGEATRKAQTSLQALDMLAVEASTAGAPLTAADLLAGKGTAAQQAKA